MARGITESDVHTAADELVANGERPTVERIRAHLGTGSPNTVTRWLETWWKNLGLRLQPKRPDLKDAPAALAELAGQWWTLALQHARESILEELTDARQTLAAEYDELRVQQQTFAEEASELHAKATASAQSERLALTQVAELRQLVDQLQSQITEAAQQRASGDKRLEQVESARRTLEARLQELQELARSERESLMEHARSVENRALRDIDFARQEAKAARLELTALRKEAATLERKQIETIERAQANTSNLRQELASQRARADAFETQLSQLRDLPAALKAAWRERKPSDNKPSRSRRVLKAKS
ncbi:cointegrate resolution protein T [Stenotrophomonas sp. ATCM1_4]|uniref:DNA-binding protein n=1 Tax=Stenotrophomonas sp. ATCM1_4 TaxID=2259330 RepID=UPI00104588B6|nr:DNA-binding protein [Stenotrophomonas sp. ATCM1_4]TDB26191.1 cointegrate resolution protein T [Stenotrophomonas sp. ATCM1_4]